MWCDALSFDSNYSSYKYYEENSVTLKAKIMHGFIFCAFKKEKQLINLRGKGKPGFLHLKD